MQTYRHMLREKRGKKYEKEKAKLYNLSLNEQPSAEAEAEELKYNQNHRPIEVSVNYSSPKFPFLLFH